MKTEGEKMARRQQEDNDYKQEENENDSKRLPLIEQGNAEVKTDIEVHSTNQEWVRYPDRTNPEYGRRIEQLNKQVWRLREEQYLGFSSRNDPVVEDLLQTKLKLDGLPRTEGASWLYEYNDVLKNVRLVVSGTNPTPYNIPGSNANHEVDCYNLNGVYYFDGIKSESDGGIPDREGEKTNYGSPCWVKSRRVGIRSEGEERIELLVKPVQSQVQPGVWSTFKPGMYGENQVSLELRGNLKNYRRGETKSATAN